jgi:hypothetical protein
MTERPARGPGGAAYLPGLPAVLSDGHSGILRGPAGNGRYPVAELRASADGPLPRPQVLTVHRDVIRDPVIHVAGSTAAAYRLASGEQLRVRGGDVLFVPSEGVAGIHCPPVLQRPLAVTAPGGDGWPGSFHALEPPLEESAGAWRYARSISMARALLPGPGAGEDARAFAAWAAAGFDPAAAARGAGLSPAGLSAAAERYIAEAVMPPAGPGGGLRGYRQWIAEAIGYGDPATLELVEDFMRGQSRTLDHLDGQQFDALARQSADDLVLMHAEGGLQDYCRALRLEVPQWAGRPAWPWHNLGAADPGWRPGRGGRPSPGQPAARRRAAGPPRTGRAPGH